MKLESILSITREDTNIYIHEEETTVSYYDGINSINIEYNEREVLKMWTEKDGLHIEIEM